MIIIEGKVTRSQGMLAEIRAQIPYGTSLGINKTLTQVQQQQRLGMTQRFILRRKAFVLGMVAIRKEDFATKQNLIGRVRVGEHTAAGSTHGHADFGANLLRHELGGTFHEGYWIPTSALRPSFSQLVPMKMQPSALNLWRTDRQSAAGTMGAVKRRGNQRAFTIFNRQGELVGIFQRFGLTNKQIHRRQRKHGWSSVSPAERADQGIRLIWRREQSIRISPRLAFAETGRVYAKINMARNVDEGIAKAIRTAKPGGGLRT